MPHKTLTPGLIAPEVGLLVARYECPCEGRDVIIINTALESSTRAETVQAVAAALIHDILFEVKQHSPTAAGVIKIGVRKRLHGCSVANQWAFMPSAFAQDQEPMLVRVLAEMWNDLDTRKPDFISGLGGGG